MLEGKIFITGGAGFLGRAIVKRAIDENWNCSFTVFSRDTTKHHFMKRMFPDADIRYVAGDIQDSYGLSNAMVGHDVCLHLAAQKYIPESVDRPIFTFNVNVIGSLNVLNACVDARVERVMGISTDKSAHPINPYGTSKLMMEYAFREYANVYTDIDFHLVRYGNVLSSTGSFITAWRKDIDELGYVRAVDPSMTRFWLTHEQAVDVVLAGLQQNSGEIYVPKLKSASMGDIASWVIPEGVEVKWQGNRGGEKTHECLLTVQESPYAYSHTNYNVIGQDPLYAKAAFDYTSENAERLTKEEFLEMIGE